MELKDYANIPPLKYLVETELRNNNSNIDILILDASMLLNYKLSDYVSIQALLEYNIRPMVDSLILDVVVNYINGTYDEYFNIVDAVSEILALYNKNITKSTLETILSLYIKDVKNTLLDKYYNKYLTGYIWCTDYEDWEHNRYGKAFVVDVFESIIMETGDGIAKLVILSHGNIRPHD